MATKAQAIRALQGHCPAATLIDTNPPEGHQVLIEAPEGHHWEGDVHCFYAPYWYNGGKADYWDMVIEFIGELPAGVACNDSDCEFIADCGECEYWEEEGQ